MRIADEIKKRLMGFAKNTPSDIVLPNWFEGFWEMDVMRITATEFIYEYEIKISKSDFKADFKKEKNHWREGKKNKHDEIQCGKRCNRFYFVCPESLIAKEDVPKYAGLIYYVNGWFRIVKNAPLIHKNKYTRFKEVAAKLAFREGLLKQRIYSMELSYNDLLNKHKQ